MKKRIALTLMLIVSSAYATIDRAGNVIDEDAGSAPSWIYIVLIVGLALWFAKEQSDKAGDEMRKRHDANQELALQRKNLADSELKVQALAAQISKMRPKAEKLELIEAVHANFVNGELSLNGYAEMVARIVEPTFIQDFGPYTGTPTLE